MSPEKNAEIRLPVGVLSGQTAQPYLSQMRGIRLVLLRGVAVDSDLFSAITSSNRGYFRPLPKFLPGSSRWSVPLPNCWLLLLEPSDLVVIVPDPNFWVWPVTV